MKVHLNAAKSGNTFSIELTPESDEDKEQLLKLSQAGAFNFRFCGHEYMNPAFRFYGFIPSSSSD